MRLYSQLNGRKISMKKKEILRDHQVYKQAHNRGLRIKREEKRANRILEEVMG